MLKERKYSNLSNILCRVNCHLLLIATLPDSLHAYLSTKSHIPLQRNSFCAKYESHFTRSSMYSFYQNVDYVIYICCHFALSLPKFIIDL